MAAGNGCSGASLYSTDSTLMPGVMAQHAARQIVGVEVAEREATAVKEHQQRMRPGQSIWRVVARAQRALGARDRQVAHQPHREGHARVHARITAQARTAALHRRSCSQAAASLQLERAQHELQLGVEGVPILLVDEAMTDQRLDSLAHAEREVCSAVLDALDCFPDLLTHPPPSFRRRAP